MKNQCIKWAERTDFTEYYLIISQKEMAIKGRRFPNWVEWELNPMGNYEWHFVVHIGRIPECERETIWNVFQEQLERKRNIQYCIELKPSDTCTGAEKHLAELLEDSRDKEALQWLNLRNATVRDLEQQHVQADRRFNHVATDAAKRTQQRAAEQTEKQRRKGGRPPQVETDKICFAIIHMFLSFQCGKTINNIKTLDDAADKINRHLEVMGSDIQIDDRRLDGYKIPGQLFRYLLTKVTKYYSFGYNEDKQERDEKMVAEYLRKYGTRFVLDERSKNRLNNMM